MPSQDAVDPRTALEWACAVAQTQELLDFHVHPFDVFVGETAYRADDEAEDLFTNGSLSYRPPSLDHATVRPTDHTVPRGPAPGRALLLASRLKYTHTGPRVFLDQLKLAGLAGALLLPVARVPGAAQEMLKASGRMFPKDGRLLPGCAFPVGIPADGLGSYFRSARETYGIRAIKIHPNLAGIDALTVSGRELLEATLVAAGSLRLPVVVHTGPTPGLEPAEARVYGALSRLAGVNWSLSAAPVILAHAGCYELTETEAVASIALLDKLFDKHPGLLADTSALEPRALQCLLARTDRSRLVFGSDALYHQVWQAWATFLEVLRLVSPRPDDDLMRIASLNPKRCLASGG